MPCWHASQLWLYHQSDPRVPAGYPDCEPFGWSLTRTHNLLDFENLGEVVGTEPRESRDEWIFAGSVIHADGRFWAYYTSRSDTFVGTQTPAELIGIATSDDGVGWVKHPEWMLSKQPGYELDNFRDPCICRDETHDRWVLLAAQRHSQGPLHRRGVLTWHTSQDLIHWDFQGDFWSPGMFQMLEMPDLFRLGDWWYLVFSEYSTGNRTRYRMSRSLTGPWLAPKDDCFDGRCLYAARTYADDVGDRHLVGWLATRRHDDDAEPWVWGGSGVVYDLRQQPDGTLTVHPPSAQAPIYSTSPTASLPDVQLSNPDGSAEWGISPEPGETYRLDCTLTFSAETFAFGVKLAENPERDLGFAYHFAPGRHRVEFAELPNYPWFRCQNRDLFRHLDLAPETPHHITLVVDRDLCVLYVDGIALSSRMSVRPGSELKLYVHGGSIVATNIRHCIIAEG